MSQKHQMALLRLIPFDDYIRIRAPQGVAWYTADLQFSTEAAGTLRDILGHPGTPDRPRTGFTNSSILFASRK